jgi:quercetin dioxygenase-like cupin family protein
MSDQKAFVMSPERCDYTGLCERICPEQAIARPFQIILLYRKETNIMSKLKFHWVEKIAFGTQGPQPHPLLDDNGVKMVLVGLEPKQQIPSHPAPAAVYYVIEGSGWMTVNDERFEIGPGTIVRTPDGAQRGIEATQRLVFLGTHGQCDEHHPAEASKERVAAQ